MITKEAIGKRVLLRRRDLGLTQKELAAKLNCPYQLISGVERGKQSLYMERFAALAMALEMDANELLGIPTSTGGEKTAQEATPPTKRQRTRTTTPVA